LRFFRTMMRLWTLTALGFGARGPYMINCTAAAAFDFQFSASFCPG
jgi:hypothetical protein